MIELTEQNLRAFAPNARQDYIEHFLANQDKLAEAGMLNDLQTVACVFGNIGEECGYFTIIRENMNYSAKNLLAVWPKRYRRNVSGRAKAAAHARKGGKFVANYNYGFRMGNRKGTDDGYDFRGALSTQATGRNMALALQKVTGKPYADNPTEFDKVDNAAEILIFTWKRWHGDLNRYASRGGINGFRMCCNAINRGNAMSRHNPIGWKGRQAAYKHALRVFGESPTQLGVLDEGDSGDGVKAMQRMLIAAGYSTLGAADGEFGHHTDIALRSFQKSNGLVVDGQYGPTSRELLESGNFVKSPLSAARAGIEDPDVEVGSKDAKKAVHATLKKSSRKAWVSDLGKKAAAAATVAAPAVTAAPEISTSKDIWQQMTDLQANMGSLKGFGETVTSFSGWIFGNPTMLVLMGAGVAGYFTFRKVFNHQRDDFMEMKTPGAKL